MPPKIFVSNIQKKVSLSVPSVRRLVREVLSFKEKKTHEVSLYFVEEKKICSLHGTYFNDFSPTDCISLPMDEDDDESYHILGEIFICPQAAITYVSKNGGNIYQELSLYVIHGLLHLIGYKDIEPKDRKIMRLQESYILNHLKIKNITLQAKSAPLDELV